MYLPLKPIDRLSILFIVLLIGISLAGYAVIPHWPWLVARYGMLLCAIVAASLAAAKKSTGTSTPQFHDFLPLIVIPVLFDSLGDMIPWLWTHYFDDLLIRIDYGIFGVHPTVWMEKMIHPFLTNTLQFAYISYYLIPLSLAIVLIRNRRSQEFDEAVFGIVLCFYLSYIGYLIFPAIGPRFTLSSLQTANLQASDLTFAIQNTLNRLENTKTDAFPSGHTAIALMTLYYSVKFKERALSFILTPIVSALIFSTVYLRYHYVVDVIAGVLLFMLTIYLAPRTNLLLSAK